MPLYFQSELEPLIMRRKHVVECSEHPCSTLPCDNQGSCSADDQGFVCSCKNNFAGKFGLWTYPVARDMACSLTRFMISATFVIWLKQSYLPDIVLERVCRGLSSMLIKMKTVIQSLTGQNSNRVQLLFDFQAHILQCKGFNPLCQHFYGLKYVGGKKTILALKLEI